MSTRPVSPRPEGAGPRSWLGGWLLLVLFLHGACATGVPRGGLLGGHRHAPLVPPPAPAQGVALAVEPGLESARVYALDFLEPHASATRPVPLPPADFQRALQRLSRDVRLSGPPREAAHALLTLPQQPPPDTERVEMAGQWLLERYRDRTYTFVPQSQTGPLPLTPEADAALRDSYLSWCAPRGGGDCLGLLEDGPFLRTDDRRTFALALAFGHVLDETRAALAQAVVAVETVALSPQGPLAVVLLKQGPGPGAAGAPGGRSSATVLRHRGGNRQVELSDGQRWHLPRGKSLADLPSHDKVGDQLQEAVTRASRQWGPDKLTQNEQRAIEQALKKGRYWLARLLEREARGRFVQSRVKAQFEHLYDFSLNKGVDVIDPATGTRYEILSGTESNLARHGRRMATEFFRMLTF